MLAAIPGPEIAQWSMVELKAADEVIVVEELVVPVAVCETWTAEMSREMVPLEA